ncbi:MAG: UvrD-helicase domain-containing protein [Holosporales bacterium]|jgi:DNA helicase-2/ATP-dependent DNA helicase PcrA|nr:UvrD-helicase domain-containing protein [Holosporales bacterium]
MQPTSQEIIDQLNPQQREAVVQLGKPLLILAGAGTGKTRVLTSKISYIITEQYADSQEILAVTFSNRAASEMKQRIPFQLGWIGTFHANCAKILRRHSDLLGIKSDFVILNQDDQLKLVKQILQDENMSDKKDAPAETLAVISRWKDAGLESGGVIPSKREVERQAIKVYEIYQDRLRSYDAVDFGDLILCTLRLFRNNQDVLQAYRDRFKYIFVDEYQDTNVAQYLWLRTLSPNGKGLCCVGDDDQSIYSWRGAEVGNILRFSQDFPDAVVIRLEQNYRSTKHILEAASGLIARNHQRLGKKLWCADENQGEKLNIHGLYSSRDESLWVAQNILQANRQLNVPLSDIAVLIRAGFQARELEEKFTAWGIPYRVIGGPRFYERQEIRDVIAYLRVVCHPDDSMALERIINVPRRGIGQSTVNQLHSLALELSISCFQAISHLSLSQDVRPSTRKALEEFVSDINRWRTDMNGLPPFKLAEKIVSESGYKIALQQSKSPDSKSRLENVKELIQSLEHFQTLQEFLEHVGLVAENNQQTEGEDMVTLMTLHSAKGQEFDTVYLCGWEEGLFPNPMSVQEGNLEEERRLAYVGITRAKRRAFITFSSQRLVYNQWQSTIPSRFISEIPKENVIVNQNYKTQGNVSCFFSKNAVGKQSGGESQVSKTRLPSIGTHVSHNQYGNGVVVDTTTSSVEVDFDDFGRKRIIPEFLRIN